MEAIEKRLDDLGHAIEAAQKSHEHGLKETSQKASEEVTRIGQQLQDIDTKQKQMQKTIEMVEKLASRMPSSDKKVDCYKEYSKGMSDYLRRGKAMNDDTLKSVLRDVVEKSIPHAEEYDKEMQTKTLFEGSDPRGGYFVRPDLSQIMIDRIFETSPLRQYANVQTTNSNVFEMIIDDNQAETGGWEGEPDILDTPTATPDIGILKIPVHIQKAMPEATQQMIDDAGFDIETWLSNKVIDRMSRTENTAFVSGDGSLRPRGFLTYPNYTSQEANVDLYARGKIEQVNSGTNGQITGDGLKSLQNRIKEAYQANSIWGIRRNSFEQIITLKDGQGRYIFNTRFLQEERTMSLLGRPVVFMNDMPDPATDSLSVVYGDFSKGYTIVDRFGFRVIRDVYTKKGRILYYTTKRVGGDVSNYESIKLLKLSA